MRMTPVEGVKSLNILQQQFRVINGWAINLCVIMDKLFIGEVC
jgi:hypothetical protein